MVLTYINRNNEYLLASKFLPIVRRSPILSLNTGRARLLNLMTFVKENKPFGVLMDEWSSLLNNSYANINVHLDEKVFNLGLVRIVQSLCPEMFQCANKYAGNSRFGFKGRLWGDHRWSICDDSHG